MTMTMPTLARPWRVLRWVARIWSIGPVLFLLGELFAPHNDPGVTVPWSDWLLVALLSLSVLALAFAWWREGQGGWASIVFLALFLLGYWIFRGEFFPWQALVWLSFILVPALLFILVGRQERMLHPAA